MDIINLKKGLKNKTDKNPEKYYPVNILKEEGFARKRCIYCKKYFWTLTKDNFCGEPECSGGYKFIKNPVGRKISFLETWKNFSKFFNKRGYTPIRRYPTAARWREDTDFVQASIYDFQPYVVNGEIEPPANPLVIPQYCVRFNSIDNVGITGRHNTGLVMIGQHAFFPEHKFNKPKYFKDLYEWFVKEIKIPREELKVVENQWGGGGNLGVCMEFFVRGLEIANQVYMLYKITPAGYEDLKLKVLDMGMGQDRIAWITKGTPTIYEIDYPQICKKLYKKTGCYPNEIYEAFIPHGSLLDADSNIELNKTWLKIANKMNIDIKELEKNVFPLAALYSIADHTQTLLMTINDGVLPSNLSGGYNLRVILRRAIRFIKKYGWDIELAGLCEEHARYLQSQYPELRKANFNFIDDLIKEEERKYKETIRNAISVVKKTEKFDLETIKRLYQSRGITPEIIKEVKPEIEIPKELYEFKTEKKEKKKQEKVFNLEGVPETEKLYYKEKTRTTAEIMKTIGEYIVLDKTVFYPRSGGQDYDLGFIGTDKVLEVIKQGNIILHKVVKKFKKGEIVEIVIDEARRKQLMQHHTAAHIINGAARRVLGEHAQQAGAEKKVDKAHLDIFHYKKISDEEIEKTEELANNCVREGREISVNWMNRTEAEQKYGFEIYQGGAVPGKEIRIVKIGKNSRKGSIGSGNVTNIFNWDVEACGGLHLKNTREADIIVITGIKKIQDSVLRIEFLAGEAARNYLEKMGEILKECSEILGCGEEQVFNKTEELFEEWKKKRK